MATKSLKNQILVPLILGLSALLAVFSIIFFWIERNNLTKTTENQFKAAKSYYAYQLENDAHLLSGMLEILINDRIIQKELKAKNREALLLHTATLFKNISSQHPVTHLYFSDAQRINILRVHNPAKHGDIIDRITTRQSESKKKTAYGLELGPLGTLTLRVVTPVIIDGELIGFVELGEEINHIITKLKNTLGIEVILFIHKKLLNRSGWENGMKMRGRIPEWDRLPDAVVVDQTLKIHNETLIRLLSKGRHLPEFTDIETSVESITFSCRFLEIKDVSGHEVAKMVIMSDITSQIARFYSIMAVIAVLSFLLGGTLFILIRLLLGRVEDKLINDQQKIIELEKTRSRMESETKFYTLAESINDAMISCESSGKIVFWNQAAVAMFGYNKDEVMGLPLTFLIPERYQKAHQKGLEEIQAGGKPKITKKTIELCGLKKDGTEFPLELSLTVWAAGKEKFYTGLIRDITERKQVAEEKTKLEERLQRAEKMESLGLLAGGVAHDLNNVLGVVVGYSDLIMRDMDQSDPIKSRIEKIMEGGQKAAAIVQDLLTLARRGVSVRDVINLNIIISDCQKSPEFEQISFFHPSVNIKTELQPDLMNIIGSSVHIGKSVFNLASNAVEAMPKGGVLTITTANSYIDKPIQGYEGVREGDYAVISVSDTGEGISETDLKRIFEPFYTKKVMGRSGTGLGLSVVWGTVKDHNGYINVHSEAGIGSTFTLFFPVTREDLSAEHVSASISEYKGKGESILIVDDVKGQRDMAEEMLRKLNYRVTSVSSGEEALVYLKDNDADIMVLDMIMDPGMDGLDTYLKVLEIRPRQKAVIVSGFSESDRVKAAQTLGAGTYVKKPYGIEKLGMAVRKELDRAS